MFVPKVAGNVPQCSVRRFAAFLCFFPLEVFGDDDFKIPLLNCCQQLFIRHINIIIKNYWQCKAGRGRLTHYQSEDPSPTLPTYRGKDEKEKIVEDKKGESN